MRTTNEVDYQLKTGELIRGPTGVWRDFAGLPTDPHHAEAEAFLIKYPWMEATSRENWNRAGNALAALAKCWQKKDEDGVSKPSADEKRRAAATSALWKTPIPCTIIMREDGYSLRVTTSYDFLLASAAAMFQAGVSMRRCVVCNDYFGLARSDGLTCSRICRLRNAKEGRADG